MSRTTIDIDDSVMGEVRQLARREQKTLGQKVSELLAAAIAGELDYGKPDFDLEWDAVAMAAKVDLDDKDAVYQVLDRP